MPLKKNPHSTQIKKLLLFHPDRSKRVLAGSIIHHFSRYLLWREEVITRRSLLHLYWPSYAYGSRAALRSNPRLNAKKLSHKEMLTFSGEIKIRFWVVCVPFLFISTFAYCVLVDKIFNRKLEGDEKAISALANVTILILVPRGERKINVNCFRNFHIRIPKFLNTFEL